MGAERARRGAAWGGVGRLGRVGAGAMEYVTAEQLAGFSKYKVERLRVWPGDPGEPGEREMSGICGEGGRVQGVWGLRSCCWRGHNVGSFGWGYDGVILLGGVRDTMGSFG